MFSANELNFSIGKKSLVQDASLNIEAGEVTVILGPNGAGKSTFMKLLAGDLRPDSGLITLDNQSIIELSNKQVAQRRAMMPQSSNVVFPFTALEIAMIGRSPHVSKNETLHDRRIVEEAMICTGVNHLASRNYNTLSGGEQQRVQLARALAQIWVDEADNCANEARYLLLDEPVASMDLAHQHETLRIAKTFSQRNVGVLLILHDINLAAMYADKIAVFKNGKIYRQGEPKAVLDEALIRNVFGVDVFLSEHPTLGCPVMVSLPNPLLHSPNEIVHKYAGVA